MRHKLRIIEQSNGGRKPSYAIEVLSVEGLNEDEETVIRSTAGLQVGAIYTLSSTDYTTGALLRSARNYAVGDAARTRGYRQALPRKKWMKKLSGVLLTLGAIVPFVMVFVVAFMQGGEAGDGMLLLFLTPFVTWPLMLAGLAINGTTKDSLTERGVALRDHLAGLEMYMKVAEAERLKVLQSPGGADRTPIDTSDGARMVRLYERVLPYAVLFGIEKEWTKTLEIAYADQAAVPDWYSGADGVFNAALLGSALSNFSHTTSTAFAPPASTSSSSSGFSSGGGFSGGGGGGGSFGGR